MWLPEQNTILQVLQVCQDAQPRHMQLEKENYFGFFGTIVLIYCLEMLTEFLGLFSISVLGSGDQARGIYFIFFIRVP